ncbi:LuxR C-terminal-related transcriptional regulator [Klebsiella sp. I138]|uniref:LuxR C-terminal-related transcriptional regulator n=1 Tax=Klebsiella sp. I138 TaxID=2755385 RepID=UPI003DA7BC6F
MLPGHGQYGIIISKIPVMQSGLKTIASECLPDYIFHCCCSPDELTLPDLSRTRLVVVDLSGRSSQTQELCEYYCFLMKQYKDIHWVYIVGHTTSPQARLFITHDNSTLISDSEPVGHVGEAICSGEEKRPGEQPATGVRQAFFIQETGSLKLSQEAVSVLTPSERKVLRLLAKGWGINQIASLLKKSNKTISAQKNSAMRRLSLRSNAQMYAWVNSEQGMKVLNIYSEYGEQPEWKNETKRNVLLSSNSV